MIKRLIEIMFFLGLVGAFIYIGKPKLAIVFYNWGNDFYNKNKYNEAEDNFKKSLSIDPAQAIVHYGLANVYRDQGKINQAEEEYERAIEIDPAYVKAYFALSHIYRERLMYPEAIGAVKRAESVAPGNQEAAQLLNEINVEYIVDCLNKGVDMLVKGDKEAAYQLLSQAKAINPDFAFTRYALGCFYYNEQNYPQAEAELENAIKADSRFWPAYKLLGSIYFNSGDYEKAINQYKNAASFHYNDSSLLNDLGLALMQMEQYGEAITYLEEALRLSPDNIDIRYSLASVYRDKGDFQRAALEYNKLLYYKEDYPNAHNDLGDIYFQQGRKLEAEEQYRQEIEYCHRRLRDKPDDAGALNNLGYAYNALGEQNKARESIERALTLQPKYRQAYLTLAKIHAKSGDNNAAQEALSQAKALSAQTNFIDREIIRLKDELRFLPK